MKTHLCGEVQKLIYHVKVLERMGNWELEHGPNRFQWHDISWEGERERLG